VEITQEKIQEWKTKYGRVRKVVISGIEYYFRPLTLGEYTNIQKLMDADVNSNAEVETIKTGVLHPEIAEEPPAGVVLTLSDEILKISGFVVDSQPEDL